MALNNDITSHSKQPPLRQITIMNTPSNNDNVDDSSPNVKHTHTASIASLTNVIAIDDAQEEVRNVMTPTPFASMDEDDNTNRTRIPMTPPPTRRGDRNSAESSHLSTISMIMLSDDGHMPSLEDHYEYHNEVIQPTASSLVGEESPRNCQQRGRFLVWPSHASAAVTIDGIIPSSA